MADTPDFQLGFAAGFKLGSDAKDYKKQIEDFRAAEAAAKEAQKVAERDSARAADWLERAAKAEANHKSAVDSWHRELAAVTAKHEADADVLIALRQQLERREGQLPERENAVLSRENAVAEREGAISKREAEADAMRRKYERLIELQDAARAAA